MNKFKQTLIKKILLMTTLLIYYVINIYVAYIIEESDISIKGDHYVLELLIEALGLSLTFSLLVAIGLIILMGMIYSGICLLFIEPLFNSYIESYPNTKLSDKLKKYKKYLIIN